MTKILADENGKFFLEKVKFVKFSRKSEIFSKIGGNLKQGGNASWPQGGWTPLWRSRPISFIRLCDINHTTEKIWGNHGTTIATTSVAVLGFCVWGANGAGIF